MRRKATKTAMVRAGPDERPCYADDRLLVADQKIAVRKEIQELAESPKIAPVIAFRTAGLNTINSYSDVIY